MQTIVIASRKGGVGKTTTARNLAVSLTKRNKRVLLIDTDKQGGLTAWWNAREADTPELLIVSYDQIGLALNKVREQMDYVIIDTPPEANEIIQSTVKYADFVLIPLKASVDDLRAVSQTIKLVQDCNKKFAFVLNEIKPNTNLTREVAEAISQYGALAPSQSGRIIHIEAAVNGLTTLDVKPVCTASIEVNKLTDYVLSKLGET